LETLLEYKKYTHLAIQLESLHLLPILTLNYSNSLLPLAIEYLTVVAEQEDWRKSTKISANKFAFLNCRGHPTVRLYTRSRKPRFHRAATGKGLYNMSVPFLYHIRRMSSDGGLLQHYFTNHRRTPSRRRLGVLSAIWGKASSRSSRKSIKSIADTLPSTRSEEMEAPLTTNGNGDVPTDTAPAVTFDADIFRSYLLALLPPVIGALPEELNSLFDDEFDERVARFAADSGGPLYVVKTKEESSAEGMFLDLILHTY
jgi:hypothetical protein